MMNQNGTLLGLHGNSAYIAQMINSQLQEAWDHAQEARANLARNLKQISDYTEVARQSAKAQQ